MPVRQTDEVRHRYGGNSGSPAIVFGMAGSGSAFDNTCTVVSALENAATAGQLMSGTYSASFVNDMVNAWGFYRDISYADATAAGPNQAAKSPEQLAFETRRARLIAAIDSMKVSAPNWSGSTQARVSEASANNAKKFLNCLPGNVILPLVAPDGEGDVMFVWNTPGQECIVTVDSRSLHLVSNLGTPSAKQVDDQRFLGFRIPAAILRHIPLK